MKRGEIWQIKIPELNGREQQGFRPAIVINKGWNKTTIIPLTSKGKASKYPFTKKITPDKENNLHQESIALIFHIRSLDEKRFIKKIGKLSLEDLNPIEEILSNYILDQKRLITPEKISKYKELTSRALAEVKTSIISGKEKGAKEIIEMVSNYLSDAEHFEKNKDFVNSFAALNYAHGWLDAGVRLSIFKVSDDKLFTVK